MDHDICYDGEIFTKIQWNSLLEVFSPTSVLCQGDPLSALLFMFVADGLSTVLRHEVEANRLTPIKIHRRAPGIFHLLFSLKPSYR
jgi:hypothetical protein